MRMTEETDALSPKRSSPPSASTIERLLSLAHRVEALTRKTGRTFVERDVASADAILAAGGEYERLQADLNAAWSDLLCGRQSARGLAVGVELVASLHTISNLAACICEQVAKLATDPPLDRASSILTLARLAPDLLRDALGALRTNDRRTAEDVLNRAVSVDACFAQTHLDLIQVIRRDNQRMDAAIRLHAVTSALERIGDGASDIARAIRAAAPATAA